MPSLLCVVCVIFEKFYLVFALKIVIYVKVHVQHFPLYYEHLFVKD